MINENYKTHPSDFSSPSLSEKVGRSCLNIGIIGAGSFAAFAANAFSKLEGIKIVAISDINEEAGKHLAGELNAKFYPSVQELFGDNDIDLVYIATPPFLHFEISKEALLAGKHVICEKPAALKTSEAQELKILASGLNLLYVVNLMQRYNPLYDVVKKIIGGKILGNFLHGFFENYASDECLNEEHWFWDEAKSGGIFIEHGVHFFDMFSGWFGEGKVLNALQLQRENRKAGIYDRVQATVLYKGGVVNFYHGFDQPKILDRQEMRLEFERGDITLYGWIPGKIKLHGLFNNEQLTRLDKIIGPCSIVEHDNANQRNREATGRFLEITFDHYLTIECASDVGKQSLYQQMLKDMLTDQWCWIMHNDHERSIDDNNAVESLQMAEQAKEIALKL
jgi:predicted dehydrogenase